MLCVVCVLIAIDVGFGCVVPFRVSLCYVLYVC
jgi:hypothetical protein